MNIFAGFCICEVPVPAGCYGWFWLAELSSLRYFREWFYYDILVPCRPFSVRFTSSASFSHLDHVRHMDRVFRRVCAPSYATPRVCVAFSFIPSIRQSDTRYSDCQCYEIRSSEDYSACAASVRVTAIPVHQSTGSGTSAFHIQLPPTALQTWFRFGFSLVAGNSALIMSLLSSFCRLQVRCNHPRFSFTVTSFPCARGQATCLISTFLPFFKGCRSFGMQF